MDNRRGRTHKPVASRPKVSGKEREVVILTVTDNNERKLVLKEVEYGGVRNGFCFVWTLLCLVMKQAEAKVFRSVIPEPGSSPSYSNVRTSQDADTKVVTTSQRVSQRSEQILLACATNRLLCSFVLETSAAYNVECSKKLGIHDCLRDGYPTLARSGHPSFPKPIVTATIETYFLPTLLFPSGRP
ncbi:hypothetical protein J6590_067336 [Homalodisca vitripennis]|nr:hypothetical protein J6590_067336 [Homalodisca vitripennis]